MKNTTLLFGTSRNQDSEQSSSTMIPQMTVVADLTPSEEEPSLKPGYAVGDCPACRLTSVHKAQRSLNYILYSAVFFSLQSLCLMQNANAKHYAFIPCIPLDYHYSIPIPSPYGLPAFALYNTVVNDYLPSPLANTHSELGSCLNLGNLHLPAEAVAFGRSAHACDGSEEAAILQPDQPGVSLKSVRWFLTA